MQVHLETEPCMGRVVACSSTSHKFIWIINRVFREQFYFVLMKVVADCASEMVVLER